ncbi:MAG: glycosyltransferase family 4 protein [Planctomycetota bacterium]
MHVAIVNHTFAETDGQGLVNLRVAEQLVDRGHEVTLIGDGVQELFAQNPAVTWRETRPPGLPTTAARHLVFARQVHRAVRELAGRYDVLHLNGGQAPGLCADVNACHFLHAPWLRSQHHPRHGGGLRGLYQSAWTQLNVRRERQAYEEAGRVVAVSSLVRDQLVEDVGLDSARITVIANASDPVPQVSRTDARRRLLDLGGWNDDPFVIMFAGEAKGRRKNLDVNLRALSQLPGHFRLVVAGAYEPGPYPAEVEQAGLSDRVAFLGHRKDVRELYAGADVFAFCSHYDPFALVIVEAMSAGLPTATTRTTGASTVVAESGGLVLETPDDDRCLASWLVRLADDKAMWQDLSQRSRVVAASRTWAVAGDAYEAVYQEAARRRRGAA